MERALHQPKHSPKCNSWVYLFIFFIFKTKKTKKKKKKRGEWQHTEDLHEGKRALPHYFLKKRGWKERLYLRIRRPKKIK